MASQRKFLCPLLFNNELPELPFDPKLLDYPFDPERHYVYRPTTLEKEEKQIMLNEPNLGIPISIIDPLAYYCSYEQKENGLDPADQDLFNEHDREEREEEETSVSWIIKPEYMTADFREETLYGAPRHWSEAKAGKASQESMLLGPDRDVHIEAIEKSFQEAQEEPIHPTDPTLKPVEVIELLPGKEIWGQQFNHIVFEQDPSPPKNYFDAEIVSAEDLCLWSIITPVSVDDQDLGVFICPKIGEFEDIDIFQDLDPEERNYSAVREYTFTITEDNRNVFITMGNDGKASYNYAPTRMIMRKRPKKRDEWFYPEITKLREIQPTAEDEKLVKQELSQIQPRRVIFEDDMDKKVDFDDSDDDSDQDDAKDELAKAHTSIFGEISDSDESDENLF